LPALWVGGHLGGRTYDVLMTGFPMRTLQATLDRAAALHPESPTLADFRAAEDLVDAEERALAGARAIVTPHAGDVPALRAAVTAALRATALETARLR
jgi:hypothetical protein